jgi:hypothetical protein
MMIELQEPEHSSRGLEVAYLTPDLFEHYWEGIEELLDNDPTLWNAVFTKQNIRDRIKSMDIQAWAVFNGQVIRLVFLTQRLEAPNGIATLQIFWMWGIGLKEVLPLLDDTIDRFAARLDCQRLEVIGRKGFERLLAPLGAEYQCTVLSRPVRTVKEH